MTFLQTLVLFLVGAVLGLIFYGGLWLTVHRLPTARHPVWLTLSSFWIRVGVVIFGLLLVVKGGWQHGLISVVGFTAARFSVSRYLIPLPRGGNADNT